MKESCSAEEKQYIIKVFAKFNSNESSNILQGVENVI